MALCMTGLCCYLNIRANNKLNKNVPDENQSNEVRAADATLGAPKATTRQGRADLVLAIASDNEMDNNQNVRQAV